MKRLIIVYFLLFSSTAFADWFGPFEVATMETTSDGVYFYNSTGFPNPDNCQNGNWVHYDGTSSKLADRAIATGLMAQASGKKIKHYLSGCYGPYLNSISIQIDPAW